MVNLLPTATDILAESATIFTDSATELVKTTTDLASNIPVIGNAALCGDSLCTTARAGINFYCSPNPLSKVFFATSCVCGVIGATSSGLALLSPVTGIPVLGWVGAIGARSFNRAGKYSYYMGNVTNGNITNTTEIFGLMS